MKYILGLNGEKLTNKIDFIEEEIGMIRGEYLCITKQQYFGNPDFVKYFIDYLSNVSSVYKDNDVYYRMADLTSNQMNFLSGALNVFREKYYMDGYRGIRRAAKFQDELMLELSCFVNAWKLNKNLALLVPFVSRVDEIELVRKILDELNYTGKLAIMAETPAACILIKKIIKKVKIDRIVVGLNDLSSFMLASNRHLSTYNVNNEASYEMVKLLINKIKSFNIEVILGGYVNENTAQFYERLGIDKMIVHYHLLPKIFSEINKDKYTSHYDTINKKFKQYRDENEKILKGIEFLDD